MIPVDPVDPADELWREIAPPQPGWKEGLLVPLAGNREYGILWLDPVRKDDLDAHRIAAIFGHLFAIPLDRGATTEALSDE